MRYLYGICNCVYFNNRPEGDITWYRSRRLRQAHLSIIREDAIDRGLSPDSAKGGIYPVRRHVGSYVGKVWLERMEDSGLIVDR